MEQIAKRDEIVKSLIDIEYRPVLTDKGTALNNAAKMPLAELSTFAAGLSTLPASFRAVTQTVDSGAAGLYRIIIPDTAAGTLVEKNGITLGNMVGVDGHTFSARARFARVGETSQVTSTTLPFNPAMTFMAIALMNIEKKLNEIQETQLKILEFLTEDKKSKLRGNLNFLLEILSKYKFNWDNETYISNMYIKVQDIKQEALQNIDFYQTAIQKKMEKKGVFLTDQDIKKKSQDIQSEFCNYQLALYGYGFASFLEVMLLKNFDAGYLSNIVWGIEERVFQYRELYAKCYNRMKNSAHNSVQAHLFAGGAAISNATGKVISKIPVIGSSQIDEKFLKSADRLAQIGTENAEKTVEQFIDGQESCVQPFVESIKQVNHLYNEPIELMFDRENLYLVEHPAE